jgi:hypothetical protein
MSNAIDIRGIDKAELLAALYNRSKPLVLGFLEATQDDMTVDQARKVIVEHGFMFNYLNGRVMKIDLSRDALFSSRYDRDLGDGAARSIVDALRSGQPAPKNRDRLAGDLEIAIARACVLGIDHPKIIRALEQRRPLFRPKPAKPHSKG